MMQDYYLKRAEKHDLMRQYLLNAFDFDPAEVDDYIILAENTMATWFAVMKQ